MTVEKGSDLHRATRGIGSFSSQNGRPGIPEFDKFAERWKQLANDEDLEYLTSQLPKYVEPDFEGPVVTSTSFESDPSIFASTLFDETIMLGLAACAASADSEDSISVDGKGMFQHIVSTTFHGATGNVTLDPSTGSRLPTTAIFRIGNAIEVPVNDTHVTYKVVDSDLFLNGEWVEEAPYVYNDGTANIPSDLPPPETNYHYIGTPMRAAGLAMAVFVALLSLGFAGWTIYNRNVHVVKASQPIFLLLLCLGTLTMGMAIVPLSIDDEIATEAGCDIACMAFPWLASIGFVLIFAALFSKTYRVYRIMNQPTYHRVILSAFDVMSPLLFLITLNVMVLALWTAVSPLEWDRQVTVRGMFGRPTESRGSCVSDKNTPFVVTLVVMDLGALVLASYQSYVARGIATEFAESDYIGKAVACMLLVSFVGVPTIFIVSDNPQAEFFLITCIIFVICTAVLLFLFVPKIMAARKGFDQTAAIRRSSINLGSLRDHTSTGWRGGQSQPGSQMWSRNRNVRFGLVEDVLESNNLLENSGEGIAIFNTLDEYRRLSEEHQKLLDNTQERKSENEKLLSEIQELKAKLGESGNRGTEFTIPEDDSALENMVGVSERRDTDAEQPKAEHGEGDEDIVEAEG
ncbi:acid type B receptor subunit 2 [Seminavis robusta]|uniref:Acid type B receptor subunit 2 n=1 Tax=Seminavis robusta TaxID=568900 RepID=A0A9N8HS79_9STRA|nr:acid type B receptor subunit 2 [Seminavis robusta]|eukprot:Sro1488_g276850.1 acid type B receptor subunit 2 (632) ;mRNA; f:902-2959